MWTYNSDRQGHCYHRDVSSRVNAACERTDHIANIRYGSIISPVLVFTTSNKDSSGESRESLHSPRSRAKASPCILIRGDTGERTRLIEITFRATFLDQFDFHTVVSIGLDFDCALALAGWNKRDYTLHFYISQAVSV